MIKIIDSELGGKVNEKYRGKIDTIEFSCKTNAFYSSVLNDVSLCIKQDGRTKKYRISKQRKDVLSTKRGPKRLEIVNKQNMVHKPDEPHHHFQEPKDQIDLIREFKIKEP